MAWLCINCAKVSVEAYDVLTNNESIHWFCQACQATRDTSDKSSDPQEITNNVSVELAVIMEKLDKLLSAETQTTQHIESLNKRLAEIDKKIEETMEDKITQKISQVNTQMKDFLTEKVKEEVKVATEESAEKQKRATNIMLFNLQESSGDDKG